MKIPFYMILGKKGEFEFLRKPADSNRERNLDISSSSKAKQSKRKHRQSGGIPCELLKANCIVSRKVTTKEHTSNKNEVIEESISLQNFTQKIETLKLNPPRKYNNHGYRRDNSRQNKRQERNKFFSTSTSLA